jgi:hypothetical protein
VGARDCTRPIRLRAGVLVGRRLDGLLRRKVPCVVENRPELATAGRASTRLFGRDEVVGDLARSPDKVTILVGDSGVGKSEVLRAAQLRDPEALCPAPFTVRNAPGALQRALLDSLASVVAELTEDEPAAQRVGRLFSETAKRIAKTRMDELAAAVGRHLLSVIRARVSAEAADVLQGVAHQLSTSVSQEFAARIADATDPDVVDVVVQFASDVVAFAGGRSLHLALDDCDRLDDSDQRRVMDFAELLPDGIALRLSFSTWDANSRARANTLVVAGARAIPLGGLDEHPIRDWLTAEGLDADWAADVLTATNGYALYVSAAIDLLRDATSTSVLSNLEPRSVLGAQTKQAWIGLDLVTQAQGARLSAVSGWLSPDQVADFLGIEPALWGALESRLVDSGIFTGTPPWFHQLRRRYLWNEVLTAEQKEDALDRAINYFAPQLTFPTGEPEAFVEYARLVPRQAALLSGNPKLDAAASADASELAIAASLMELMTPTPSALLAENVLLYARQVFNAQDDLVAALHRLARRDLVHLASNEFVTVVVPIFGTIEVVNLLAGRAAGELRRLPVPQVATALFQTKLRSVIGTFRSAQYGVGAPRIAELSREAVQMQRRHLDGSIHVGPNKGPNVLVRLRYGELPLYATIVYDEDGERDDAARRLDGFDQMVWDRQLVVTEVLRHPLTTVPSLRFLNAAELLTGRTLANSVNGTNPVPKLDTAISLDEEMAKRATVLNVVHDLTGPMEKLAYGLERPIGYVYFGDETHSEITHVIGGGGAQRLSEFPVASATRGFHRVEIARLAHLASDERLGLMTWRQGSNRDDPVISELAWLSKQAASFNDQQDRTTVVLDEQLLQQELDAAAERAGEDAARMAAALAAVEGGLDYRETRSFGRTTYLAVFLDKPMPGFVPGSHVSVLSTHVDNDTGMFDTRLQILPADERHDVFRGSTWEEAASTTAALFGIDPACIHSVYDGFARSVLAKMLGHRESELSFQFPIA